MNLKNFWFMLTMASLLWYTFVTAYVAWRGFGDIRHMLRRLRPEKPEQRGAGNGMNSVP